MEKQRIKFGSKLSRGLLAFVLLSVFASSPLYAKFITNNDVAKLRFDPSSGQQLYTGTDIKFEVIIPGISSSDINVLAPEEMDNVTFRTLKRTDVFLDDDEEGAKIELWFSFSKKGTYELKPLSLKIQGFNRRIAFNPVVIKTNPKDQDPIILIKFQDGTVISSEFQNEPVKEITLYTGQKTKFTVLFQYGVQLVNFDWEIPKDSIFTQTKAYEITQLKYKEKNSVQEEIPVSDFEWTPLVAGDMAFPSISMVITSNNGYKGEVKLQPFTVKVLKSKESVKKNQNNLFEQAFVQDVIQEELDEKHILTITECEEIAGLRIKERKSLFGFGKIKRSKIEQSYGLPSDTNEFPVFYIWLSAFFLIVSIVLFVILFRKKKVMVNICIFTLIVLAVVSLSVCIVKSNTLHGISKGCKLYAIPDTVAESKSDLQPGSYVTIKEKSGQWYYVQLGENGGWCDINDIILIK